MKPFLQRFSIFLIPLVLLGIFQLLVDPLDIYAEFQLLPPITATSRTEKVLNYLNETERDFDTLILGSSRAMRLKVDALAKAGYNAYNFSVHSAMAEDLYCILQFVLEHNRTPLRHIILGIDPECFHNNRPPDNRLLQEHRLSNYLIDGKLITQRPQADQLQLLSDSFRYTFASVWLQIVGVEKDPYLEFDSATGELALLLPRYNLAEIDQLMATSYKQRFAEYSALDEDRQFYFDNFIKLCANNGIEVWGFVTPLHPQLDAALQEQGIYQERLNELFTYFDGITYDEFHYVDFSIPSRFGGDDYDFKDAAHIGDYNATLIIQQLLSRR